MFIVFHSVNSSKTSYVLKADKNKALSKLESIFLSSSMAVSFSTVTLLCSLTISLMVIGSYSHRSIKAFLKPVTIS